MRSEQSLCDGNRHSATIAFDGGDLGRGTYEERVPDSACLGGQRSLLCGDDGFAYWQEDSRGAYAMGYG